jgi:LTXXQ motif family protein
MIGLSRCLVVSASLLAAAALTSGTLARGGGSGAREFVSLCMSSGALDLTLSRIDTLLKTSGAQTAALEELKEAAKENSENMSRACAGSGDALDFPARLTAAETRLDAALAEDRKLEPLAAKFYATLDGRQKDLVSRLVIWPGQ